MAVALVQHPVALRLGVAPTQQSSRKISVLGTRFESGSLQCCASLSSVRDAALAAQVLNSDDSSSKPAAAFAESRGESRDADSSDEEGAANIGKRNLTVGGANEPLGAAAFVVPGRTYGRLKINLDLLLYRAKQAQRRKRRHEAETILRECIRDWPDEGRAYVALGTSLVRAGKIKEARGLYEGGCQACRGENPYIWQAWAVLEERAGDISKARSLFDAATAADKKHAAAWHGWAVLELRSGNVKKSRSLLMKGLKFCGQNQYMYQTLAIIEVRTGRIEDARSYFMRATRVDPKSAASWLAWALMEAEFGIKDVVRRLFQKGLQAVPRNGYIWQAWARFEAREGNRGRARELFQRGTELCPKDVVILQAFALFEYECGQAEIARRHFRRGMLIDPRHQPLWLAWGWVEWKEGNYDAARECYQKSLMINNKNMNAVRTYQAWGVLEGRTENYGAARALFKSALKLDSQNMPAWLSWAAMEEHSGNAVRADELRNLCLQQRVEVVEEPAWDPNVSELLAPTVDGLTDLLESEKDEAAVVENKSVPEKQQTNTSDEKMNTKWTSNVVDDFDVDAFLHEKFPWKYPPPQQQQQENLTNSSRFSR